MMKRRKRKCPYCHQWFLPHPQTAYHQKCCSNTHCQSSRRIKTQAGWRRRNPDYYRGPENVRRVREWRQRNPDYKRSRRSSVPKRAPDSPSISLLVQKRGRLRLLNVLQDVWPLQSVNNKRLTPSKIMRLQDLFEFSAFAVLCSLREEKGERTPKAALRRRVTIWIPDVIEKEQGISRGPPRQMLCLIRQPVFTKGALPSQKRHLPFYASRASPTEGISTVSVSGSARVSSQRFYQHKRVRLRSTRS